MAVHNRFNTPKTEPIETGTDTKVQQQFADKTDINKVVKRFKKTGVLQSTIGNVHQQRTPVFGVYPHTDYQDMYLHVQQVKEQFQALPGRVRQRFDNNPSNVVRFIDEAQHDPRKLAEALKLGLMVLPEGYELDKASGKVVEVKDAPKEAPKEDGT